MTYPNDSSRIAEGLAKLEASNPNYTGSKVAAARSLIRKTYILGQVASVLANGDDAIVANNAPSVYFKNPVRIMGVTIQNRVALTASSDNQQLSLKPVSATGVIGTTIATANTDIAASGGTGDLVAGQSFSLTVDTASNHDRVAAGTWVGVAIAPNASGVAIGATSWAIDVEEEGPDGYSA